MLQFLQYKTFGNQAVPEGWVIVTAGNPPEYNKSVREFDLVTTGPGAAHRRGAQPARLAGVRPRPAAAPGGERPIWSCAPQHFYKVEQDVDGAQFVTARGWEDLSAMLQTCDALDLPVDEGLIGQYLRHPEVSRGLCRLLGAVQKVSRGLRRGGHFAGQAL